MKKLEELGISPAPWRATDDGIGECDIRCSGVSYGEDYDGEDIIASMIQKNDAPMFAAAPELYKWLAYAVEQYRCETRTCNNCPNGKCWIVDASAALAKASGEEATDTKTLQGAV